MQRVLPEPSSAWLIGCMLLLAGGAVAQAQPPWEEFIDIDGRFSVRSPVALTAAADTVETALGPLVYHTFYYQAPVEKEENYFFMVSYCDYPENSLHSDSLDLLNEFFEATIESAVQAVKGELRYQTEVDLLGFPGRFWRIDFLDEQAVVKTKAFVVRSRYYAVQAISPREKSYNNPANRFLDSFRVLY